MAKKQKYDAPQTTEPTNESPPQVEGNTTVAPTDAGSAANPAPEGNGEAAVARAGWYLKTAEADKNGRTDYRFAKYAGYPKKPSEIDITIDGEKAKLAVTSSGGWADEATKGYNGYIQYQHPVRGLISGWILFGHGVNPREMPLDFTTVDGSCDANPKRIPANPTTEEARKTAFKAAMDKKKAEAEAKKAAEDQPEGTEGGPTPEQGAPSEGATAEQPPAA
jgi:hypothetical protein